MVNPDMFICAMEVFWVESLKIYRLRGLSFGRGHKREAVRAKLFKAEARF